MIPKEKALELINKYCKASFNCLDCDIPYCDIQCTSLSLHEGKECALITVNEILYVLGGSGVYSFADTKVTIYWEDVKSEIERL